MDKLNNYIPVLRDTPIPIIVKPPCLTPACIEINKKFEESMKQLQSQPISQNKQEQNQLK